MRIVAIIIQPPRLLDTVPGLLSNRTVAWSETCRSRSWSSVTSTVTSWETLPMHVARRCIHSGAMSNGWKGRMWSAVETGGGRGPVSPPVPIGGGPQPVEHLTWRAARRRCRDPPRTRATSPETGTGGRRPGSALDVLLRGEQREFVRPRERLPVTGDGDREGAGDRGGGQSVAGISAKEAGGEIAGDERVARADGVDSANRHRGHLH